MNARLGIVALGMALALAACSEGEKPAGSLPQITRSPSASPSPSVPAFPATRAGAADFVTLWIRQTNVVQTTGNLAGYERLIMPSCVACTRFVESMRTFWSEGTVQGGVITTRYVTPGLVQGDAADVTVDISATPVVIRNRDGSVRKRYPAMKAAALLVHLKRVENGWQVDSFRTVR